MGQKWEHRTRKKRHFPDSTMWWNRLQKKKIRQFYIQEWFERRRNTRNVENLYYECMYEDLPGNHPHKEKLTALNRFRVKVVQLHSAPLKRIMLENEETGRMEGEISALYHALGT